MYYTTKKVFIMKKAVLLSNLLLVLAISLHAQNNSPETRNTLWLDGLSTTSKGWDETPRDLKNIYNYDLFNIISLGGLPGSVYQPGLGTFDAADELASHLGDYENVLGIGHDFGGLVLRGMADGTNNLSAIVLCGVPNQGSKGIEMAIQSTGVDGKSDAQWLIEGVEAITDGYDCEDGCNMVDLFSTWIDELEANEAIFSEMLPGDAPGGDVINTLNQEANLPQIPHAVFWGSVEEFSITSFLNSIYFPNSNVDHITQCYVDNLNAWKEEINDERREERWDAVFGLFNDIKGGIRDLSTEGISNPWSAISSFAEGTIESVRTWLNANNEHDAEMERILRCEAANQLLAINWQLELMKAESVETGTVQQGWVYDNTCEDECAETVGYSNWIAFRQCIVDCEDNQEPIPNMVTYYVTEENDGLLNANEQMLEGGAFPPYHLFNTNHFQETSLYHKPGEALAPLLPQAFEDLFDGSESAAFCVPKQ
ncbi:MAG: hypothetical protein GVY26_00380 [Bacteroidetes bacterium]|jgi:hypothetical protein|nr:hypothetical protein [Bacteroidota bacterium]